MKKHELLITSLSDFIQGKSNVHGEIRRYVASLKTSFRRISEKAKKTNSKTIRPAMIVSTQRKLFETTMVKDSEDDEEKATIPRNRPIRLNKRKKRTSPEEFDKMNKKLRGEKSVSIVDDKTEPNQALE